MHMHAKVHKYKQLYIYIYQKMFKCMFDRHWYARTPRGRLPEACKSNQRHLYFVQLLLEGSALLWHTSKIANSVSLNIAQDLEGLLPRMHETLWVTGSWMWTQIQTDHNYIYICVCCCQSLFGSLRLRGCLQRLNICIAQMTCLKK